ncbi:MAG: prolyl oligopeptidase family serine peptidase [Clostridia bacterium]|nr:prolyl oligopeptidase family serine peptidase [Clostridia bacterium]
MKKTGAFESQGEKIQLPYFLTRPDDSTPDEKLPMIVFLHGAGERAPDLEKVKVHGIAKLFNIDQCHGGTRVITLAPQCPEGDIWSNFPGALMELILHVAEVEGADMDRISITGLSMGGFGTWTMLARYPTFFSAAAPICGGGISWYINTKTPIRTFHGDADRTVPIQYTYMMADALNARGGNVDMVVFHGCDHDSWTRAYEQTDLVSWLANSKKG